MMFLQKPNLGQFLASRSLGRYNLEHALKNIDACICDLDGTDCQSPARELALHNWPSRFLKEKKYRNWLLQSAKDYLRHHRKAESRCWQSYVSSCLPMDNRNDVPAIITPAFVQESLYPGVAEFYSRLDAARPGLVRCYISQNIPEVVSLYAQLLGMSGMFCEAHDKARVMELFVESNPSLQHYLVRGDSHEDQSMLDVLRSCQRRQKIKSAIGIYCASRPLAEKHNFDVEVSKDQRTLVDLLP